MKKISVLFQQDHENDRLLPEVRADHAWVLAGEGVATVKFDGTSCLWRDGQLWKRYDRKLNKAAYQRRERGEVLGDLHEGLFKVPPAGFVPCEAAPDPVTFHWPGWVPVSETDPGDQWHREALAHWHADARVEGQTYELVGPALSKNPYHLPRHELWRHGAQVVDLPDRSFEAIAQFLAEHEVEGLVFHHPDGRMAKIRRKDFGLFWVQEDTRVRHRAPRP